MNFTSDTNGSIGKRKYHNQLSYPLITSKSIWTSFVLIELIWTVNSHRWCHYGFCKLLCHNIHKTSFLTIVDIFLQTDWRRRVVIEAPIPELKKPPSAQQHKNRNKLGWMNIIRYRHKTQMHNISLSYFPVDEMLYRNQLGLWLALTCFSKWTCMMSCMRTYQNGHAKSCRKILHVQCFIFWSHECMRTGLHVGSNLVQIGYWVFRDDLKQ